MFCEVIGVISVVHVISFNSQVLNFFKEVINFEIPYEVRVVVIPDDLGLSNKLLHVS